MENVHESRKYIIIGQGIREKRLSRRHRPGLDTPVIPEKGDSAESRQNVIHACFSF